MSKNSISYRRIKSKSIRKVLYEAKRNVRPGFFETMGSLDSDLPEENGPLMGPRENSRLSNLSLS
ncbi:MAG: hypothetical protein HY579_08845 [Nitrospinae bacterium]|nr:hypothetical protein [Nitrospinota bacterium]